MNTTTTAALGALFFILGVAATGLMYHYWGYPFDDETRKSSAPQWKMNIHRAVGFGYVIAYVILMVQMVPRMWHYQIELPARTVVHIVVGITIGVLLLIKISILRFFRHFEEWMPYLGTALLLCTFILLGLSLPFVYRERTLVAAAPGGSAFSASSRTRVAALLPTAGLPDDVDAAAFATDEALREGRDILLGKCVHCHDLRTVIARPRTPADWLRTVRRMADKPTLGEVIAPRDVYRVTAFLVAITPDLQRSAKAKRAATLAHRATKEAMHPPDAGAGTALVPGEPSATPPEAATIDPAKAKAMFERTCSQCHKIADVEGNPPEDAQEVDDLVDRMIDNGLEAEAADLVLVKWYLNATFVHGD